MFSIIAPAMTLFVSHVIFLIVVSGLGLNRKFLTKIVEPKEHTFSERWEYIGETSNFVWDQYYYTIIFIIIALIVSIPYIFLRKNTNRSKYLLVLAIFIVLPLLNLIDYIDAVRPLNTKSILRYVTISIFLLPIIYTY